MSSYNGNDDSPKQGVPRVPEKFLIGDATMKEYLEYLRRIDPMHDITVGDYVTLTDWVGALAEALDISAEEQS